MTMLIRSASLSPSSFNAEAGTVEAVITSYADVTRRDGRGAYVERLDPAGLDTSDLIGIPVLNAHRQGDARDAIGVVASTRHEPGALVATIRLTTADDAAPVVQRICEGVLTGISIGYRVQRWDEATEQGRRIRVARSWSIHEVSAVPVPADPHSRFRSRPMPELTSDTIVPEPDHARIRALGELADLPPSFAEGQIAAGATVEEARTALRAELIQRSQATPHIRVASPAAEDPATILERRAEALAVRMGVLPAPSDAARPFMEDRLIDHARAAVERTGVSTRGMDADQIFTRAMHTTSDFPALLKGAGNRSLLPAYQAAQSPLKRLARQASAPDFRAQSRLRIGGTGVLEKVSESGEIKSVTRAESAESYKIDTYASLFSLSRKALINDDLGAFRDWGIAAGRAAAQTEAQLLWDALSSNGGRGAKLADGKPIFHTDHKNLKAVSGQGFSDIGGDALTQAKLMITRQKDLDGKTPIYARPKFILVSPENEDIAAKLIAAIYPPTVADVNVFTNAFEILSEPRIQNDDFWMFCTPESLPVLEYAYLSSAPGPQLSSRDGWDVLGTEWRVVLDFGVGAIDHRGAALIADV